MTGWSPDDLTALGAAHEIALATERPDGTARHAVTIWVVRVGDDLYVRSFNGAAGSWNRQLQHHPYARVEGAGRRVRVHLEPVDTNPTGIDEAYRDKYGRHGYGSAMTAPDVAATTRRLEPAP